MPYTPPGMAHWAGTGPEGLTCAVCLYYHEKRCSKYRKLTGQKGKPIGGHNAACRHFEERPAHK